MIHADHLRNLSKSQQLEINRETQIILANIDDELKRAHEVGKTQIITTLPITFSISYMRNSQAQRQIYFNVLTSLLNRGFDVKINVQSQSAAMTIKWITKEEETQIAEQNTILAQFSNS